MSFFQLVTQPVVLPLVELNIVVTQRGLFRPGQLAESPSECLNDLMEKTDCPFCHLEERRILLENEFVAAFPDGFPIAEGHALVVPKRHVASLFDLTGEEQAAVWSLVAQLRAALIVELRPDGFNVGLNDGPAAGQTVMHAHVHVIPRHRGDSEDPRGGVRWVLPKKAQYWGEGH